MRVTARGKASPCAEKCRAKATGDARLACYRACPGVTLENTALCKPQPYPLVLCEGRNDNTPNVFFGVLVAVAVVVVAAGYIALKTGRGPH